jgi:hypothetical protein
MSALIRRAQCIRQGSAAVEVAASESVLFRWATARNVPIAVVGTRLRAKKFLFSCLVGKVPACLVTVFFGLKERGQVDA